MENLSRTQVEALLLWAMEQKKALEAELKLVEILLKNEGYPQEDLTTLEE